MDLLVVIFSGAALLGVTITLIGFVRNFPENQRIAVGGLLGIGALLIVVVGLALTAGETNSERHEQLCDAIAEDRSAIRSLIAEAEATDGEAFPGQLEEAAQSVKPPPC